MDGLPIISWLLQGDVSIQYQVHRDLLGNDRKDLQDRIANEGWENCICPSEIHRVTGKGNFINLSGSHPITHFLTFAI